MMEETTAAVLFGASNFPKYGGFSNESFLRSKHDFEDYLHEGKPRGLGLKAASFCDLFDSSLDPGSQLRKIGEFADKLKTRYPDSIRNLIVFYVGHGYFVGSNREYYLALSSTDSEVPDSTGLRLASLGDVLKKRARSFRVFYILDCCFAGEAIRSLQCGIDAIAESAAHSLRNEGIRVAAQLPRCGSAVLCATSSDDVARAPEGHDRTVFSDALLDVLKKGDAEYPSAITLSGMTQLIWNRIREKHAQTPDYMVRPTVHAPDQSDGDLSTHVAIFPNPGYREQTDAGHREAGRKTSTGPKPQTINAESPPTSADELKGVDRPRRRWYRKKRYIFMLMIAAYALLAAIFGQAPDSQSAFTRGEQKPPLLGTTTEPTNPPTSSPTKPWTNLFKRSPTTGSSSGHSTGSRGQSPGHR